MSSRCLELIWPFGAMQHVRRNRCETGVLVDSCAKPNSSIKCMRNQYRDDCIRTKCSCRSRSTRDDVMVHEVRHARARSDTDFHSKRLNCVANRTHRERMGRWSHATWFSACYDKLVLVANQQQSTSLSTNRASDDYFIFPPATKSKTTIKTVAIRSASDMESAFAYSHFAIDRMIGVKSSMSFVLSPTWCYYCHVYVICSSSPIR